MANIYLGLASTSNKREIFRSDETPTFQTHGEKYNAVVGPFQTRRAAEFMRDFGRNNPHCQCVADAERLAKKYWVACGK
jgi:hypothetical protein